QHVSPLSITTYQCLKSFQGPSNCHNAKQHPGKRTTKAPTQGTQQSKTHVGGEVVQLVPYPRPWKPRRMGSQFTPSDHGKSRREKPGSGAAHPRKEST